MSILLPSDSVLLYYARTYQDTDLNILSPSNNLKKLFGGGLICTFFFFCVASTIYIVHISLGNVALSLLLITIIQSCF